MKILYYIPRAILILCVALFFTFCKGDQAGKKGEGTLEFDTRGVDEKHPFFGLAPSSATLKFKGDQFIMEMSTMGMFNTSIIGDVKAKTIAQTVKFMNIKQACVENEKDIQDDNKDYLVKTVETKETKLIAGLKCHKVKVTMADNPAITFDIWYTKELGMENCNSLTPYAQLKLQLVKSLSHRKRNADGLPGKKNGNGDAFRS